MRFIILLLAVAMATTVHAELPEVDPFHVKAAGESAAISPTNVTSVTATAAVLTEGVSIGRSNRQSVAMTVVGTAPVYSVLIEAQAYVEDAAGTGRWWSLSPVRQTTITTDFDGLWQIDPPICAEGMRLKFNIDTNNSPAAGYEIQRCTALQK